MVAAGVFTNLDAIDVIEVIAEDWMGASHAKLRALRSLGREVPLTLHGVTLGLASVVPVETSRLDRLARLAGALEPVAYSEHLAFVRGGGFEIGHLAARPRCADTAQGAVENLLRLQKLTGRVPALENVATLVVIGFA